MSTSADVAAAANQAAPLGAANQIAPAAANAPRSGAHKISFRFFACFIFLLVFPFPFNTAPGSIVQTGLYDRGEFRIAEWVGAHVLHVAPSPAYFSDIALADTNAGYIQLLLIFLVSIVATILWSLLDRRRGDYRRLHEYLRCCVRYALAL